MFGLCTRTMYHGNWQLTGSGVCCRIFALRFDSRVRQTNFAYGDTINIPDTVLGASSGGGNVSFKLKHPTTETVDATAATAIDTANTTPITTPGGLFSGTPQGASISSVASLDVLTVFNALKMLTAVDAALTRIDLERSDLGSTMSRMGHTISNLSNIVMNTQASRSRINDADIALESTELY